MSFTAGNTGMQVVTPVFIGFTLGFLAPRRWLRIAAARRQQAIAQEMPIAIHMLRMVFDAGLSTEHALRVLHDEGRVLMPNLAEELEVALHRINAGQDRADALDDMAAPLDVPDLTGTVAILKQVTRYGGSIRDSLMKFAQLIEERQQAALREQVGKLSTKMTVVMVVFLFPALMIFLAGPGFLALGRALMGVHG
jgi:Flp pilus assembly protein TadC